MNPQDWHWILAAIVGLAVTTVLTRSFFLFPDREIPLPGWFQRGLKYAPLAALSAVIFPEVLMGADGEWLHTWQNARLWAVPAATAYYFYRRGILGTIVVGMAVYLPLRIGLGW